MDNNWTMTQIRVSSVQPPFEWPDAGRPALRLLLVADAIGVLPGTEPIHALNLAVVRTAVEALVARDVATAPGSEILQLGADEYERWAKLLTDVIADVRHSPLPETEWAPMLDLFGADVLASLVGVSPASVQRYATGTRATPDDVAERLHFLALLVAELAASFNEIGVRRWFHRPLPQIDGDSPSERLRGDWSPHDSHVDTLMDVARGGVAQPAT
jgi:hypothetical protein